MAEFLIFTENNMPTQEQVNEHIRKGGQYHGPGVENYKFLDVDSGAISSGGGNTPTNAILPPAPTATTPKKSVAESIREAKTVTNPVSETPEVTKTTPPPTPVTPEPLKTTPTENADGTVAPAPESTTTTTPEPTKTQPEPKEGEQPVDITQTESAPKTEDEAFQALQKGGTLVKTAQTARWKKKFDSYQKLNSLSASSLADMNVKGLISADQMNRLSQLNPQKWAEVNKMTENGIKIDGINQASERLYNSATGKKTENISMSQKIDEEIASIINSDKPSIRDLRDEYLNGNQKIKDLKVDIATKDAAIEELQDTMAKTYDDLRGQYPTLPKSILLGMASAQNKRLNESLTTMIRERNMVFSEYTAEKEASEAMMKFDRDVIAEDRANRTEQLTYLQNKFNTFKKDEDWEKEKQFELKKLEDARAYGNEQEIKQHERNLEILKLGQDFQKEESRLQREQAMEIVNKQMAGTDWKTGGNGIEESTGREYILQENSKTGEIRKKYLDEIGTQGAVEASDGSIVSYGTDNNGNLTADFGLTGVVPGDRWQCAEVVNDKAGLSMGDTYESKLKFTQKGKQPQVGDVFVSPKGIMVDGKNTGHTGFVKTVFPDGSIELWESNLVKDKDGKGVTSTRIIKPTDSYYKELQFGKTKFTNTGSISAKTPLTPQQKTNIDLAIRQAQRMAKTNAKMEMVGDDIKFAVDNYGLGSDEVIDTMSGIVTAGETGDTKKIGETIKGLKSLNNILADIDSYEQQYGSSAPLFGFSANMSEKIQTLQNSLGSAPDERTKARIQMEMKILQNMQTYRKAMTGAAASVLETGEYKSLFPGKMDGDAVAMTKLKTFRDMMQENYIGDLENAFTRTGYQTLIGGAEPKQSFTKLNDNKFYTQEENTSSMPEWLQNYWGQLTMQ